MAKKKSKKVKKYSLVGMFGETRRRLVCLMLLFHGHLRRPVP